MQSIKMDPQCEIVGKYILPIYRSILAKELVKKHHLTQTEAAKKLGTTQAAVSQYLSSKRAYKGIDHVEQYLPKIQTMAIETAKKIVSKEIGVGDVTFDFCKLCSTFCNEHNVESVSPKPEYYI